MAFPSDSFSDATDFALHRSGLTDGPKGGVAGANKLWLPLWSGEVIHAYDQYNIFENLITAKNLTGGFSWEFPVTGTVALNPSWDAGEELGGGSSTSTTFKVNLDNRPMAAHFETDNVDALVTQWDYRSELARQAGQTLANTRDRQIAVALLAACAVDPLASDPRGSLNFPAPVEVSNSAASAVDETAALNILKAIEDYFVHMQENDFPINNVYCVVTPKVFQTIRGLGITRSADLALTTAGGNFTKYPLFAGSSDMGGLGGPLSMGMNTLTDSLEYMGCRIIKSNHLPTTNYSANANANIGGAKYNVNASTIKLHGMIFQPEAVAGLSLMGMKVDTVQDVRRNTQFTVASMMKGTGILRPELCQALVGYTNGVFTDNAPTRAELDAALGANYDVWETEYRVTQ
jgi:hypothetical protein